MVKIYGNRQIKTLRGLETRPTTARVREALFNIWQADIAGCHWLDLCCGSGSMGAEALCRGATSVIGIERSKRACALIRQNWQQVAEEAQTFEILQGDVVQRLKQLAGQSFGRIYFDPPYDSELYQPVLAAIAQNRLLDPSGELAVEHGPHRPLLAKVDTLVAHRTKYYGNTALTFFHHNSSSSDEKGQQDEKEQLDDGLTVRD